MTTHIDPLILRKLADFSQRRRKLIILRGLCVATATLLLAMMIVAAVDAFFVLPDVVRWSLSGVAYLTVLVVEWRASLRLLLKAPGRRELARMVETADPRLRESLLSAVELSEQDTESTGLSTQFRQLLEQDVARRLSHTDMEGLLPVNLVRRSITIGAAALLLCLGLFAVTGMQFGTLLLRALAPGANLARVSQVKVRVVEPTSPDKVVAQGETEPLVIEISGRRVNAARLETITASGRDVLKMTPLEGDRFSATIQVGREDVQYRVFAGDAVTRKFRLQAVARPHVAKFTKTFTFPAYARREPQTVTEENGDLVALEGSEVELRLATNQRVRSGELRLEQGKETAVVTLAAVEGHLVGRVPLHASGTYRVHLVSADTGFENKFSPEYEVRAEPDLVPQVALEAPTQDLILPANEIVALRGLATDDQGLAKVSQFVKINDGGWREVRLVADAGKTAPIARQWDLYEQGVKPGDLVLTKLVAQDLKGSRAESETVRVSITKSGFETKRLEALEAQRALAATLQGLRAAGEQLARRGKEVREQFERLGEGDEQRRQVALTAQSAHAEWEQALTAAWTQLGATLRGADAGYASADLVQIGRLLVRSAAGTLQPGRAALDLVVVDPFQPQARELMRDFAEACERAEQRMRKAEDSHRVMLGGEEFAVITENLLVIAAETRRLTELAAAAGDATAWTQVANRLRVVLAEGRSVEQIADASTPRAGDRLKWMRKQLGDIRGEAERQLGKGEPGPALRDLVQNYARLSETVARGMMDNFRDFLHRAVQEHVEIFRDLQPTAANLERLEDDLSRIAARHQWPEDLRRTLAEQRWEARGEVFQRTGDLEEARPAADAFFVHDLRTAQLALESLRIAAANEKRDETKRRLNALEHDFRLLEGGHQLAELLDGLQHLAGTERWEIATARERLSGPREWRWLEARLRFVPEELSRIRAEEKLRPTLQEVTRLVQATAGLPAWNELNREMQERFNPQREMQSGARALEPIAAQVKQALELLRQPMAEARQRLAEQAPKLHEMMKDLAQKSEELQQKTAQQAQPTAEKSAEQMQAEAQRALAEQQKLNERVENLKDALRADANRQDILNDAGRERARDADDALALLKEPPPKAEAALSDAAQAPDPKARTEAMQAAAQEQQKLASALEQLAQHYENVEQGKAQESRTALRKTEEQLGVKEALDRQFAKAQELAKMAQDSPQELLKKLEQALPKNATMQQELSTIARNTLDEATLKLRTASSLENQVAGDVKKLAQEQQAQAANQPDAANPAAPNAPPPPSPPTAQNSPAPNANAPRNAGQPAKAEPQTASAPPPTNAPAQPRTAPEQSPTAPKPSAPQMAQNSPSTPPPASQPGEAPNAASPQSPTQPPTPPANPQLAQAAEKQKPISEFATAAGEDVARAGRHEQRLNNKEAGEKLEQLGNQVKETGAEQVPKVGEALAQAQQAAQAAPAVEAANEKLRRQLTTLQLAAAAPKAQTPMSRDGMPMPPEGPSSPAKPDAANTPQAAPPSGEKPSASAAQAPSSNAAPPYDPKAGTPGDPSAKTAESTPANTPPGSTPANAAAPPSPALAGKPAPAPPGSDAGPLPPLPTGLPGMQLPAEFAQNPAAKATPTEQVWMARTLDALDAALNSSQSSEGQSQSGQQQSQQGQQAGQQAQQGPQQQGQQVGQQPGQQAGQPQSAQSQQMAAAQQAMNNAAKAAAAAMRQQRADKPSQNQSDPTDDGPEQAVSRNGAQAQAGAKQYGKLQDARGKAGEWGKLPKQVAEQLTRGKNENVAGEYRNQVETYYKVIAEKSKKP